jgi:signal peptidase I
VVAVWVLGAVLGTAAAGVLVAAGVVLLRRRYVVVRVAGESMAPTLRHGDRVLVRRLSGHRVRPGQVVVLEGPALDALRLPVRGPAPPPLGTLVKRVVAVAGDPVPPHVPAPGESGRVPAGKLVVLGDNTAASVDSRTVGFFAAGTVTGVVLRRLRDRAGALGAPRHDLGRHGQWS